MRSSRSRFFEPEKESVFYCGLDLGQSKDYTAFCAIERRPGLTAVYHVRSLKRFRLGTSYPHIVERVRGAVKNPGIDPNLLLVDNTGVGAPVSDMMRREGLVFYPIMITGGERVTRNGGHIHVPKRDLVSSLQVLFQTNRLKIAGQLQEAQTLIDELENFRVKISLSGHDSYGAWREGSHDDLVLAVAMACWAGEKRLLPKGLRWPRLNTGRRLLGSGKKVSGGSPLNRYHGPKLDFFVTWIGDTD